MTPSQLSAIRARLDAATPGPWRAQGDYVLHEQDNPEEWDIVSHCVGPNTDLTKLDAALIANAPTDLRALLDEVERLTKRENVLVQAGLDLMVVNKDLIAERDAAYQHTAEAFQRGVETFRRHFHAFALGATSYGRPSKETQVILDELPRMQVDDPEAK